MVSTKLSSLSIFIYLLLLLPCLKIANKKNTFWLHSHAIQWATGSGQQSVTAHGGAADIDNMWLVKEADPSKTKVACITGTPIKCGDVVRLQHVTTSSNLHSHLFRSPLSGQQEVSCFGTSDQKMGLSDGDTGDNWIVMCDITKEGKYKKEEKII